jgi:hypothetical protein
MPLPVANTVLGSERQQRGGGKGRVETETLSIQEIYFS